MTFVVVDENGDVADIVKWLSIFFFNTKVFLLTFSKKNRGPFRTLYLQLVFATSVHAYWYITLLLNLSRIKTYPGWYYTRNKVSVWKHVRVRSTVDLFAVRSPIQWIWTQSMLWQYKNNNWIPFYFVASLAHLLLELKLCHIGNFEIFNCAAFVCQYCWQKFHLLLKEFALPDVTRLAFGSAPNNCTMKMNSLLDKPKYELNSVIYPQLSCNSDAL